ncbi:MAG: gliding motility-associated C-terminal domain-containing protein [Bacteroidia bacterium]|nr:gliding motility-associated C-terminal domain-containing protein [Bacteroidia bacterium]
MVRDFVILWVQRQEASSMKKSVFSFLFSLSLLIGFSQTNVIRTGGANMVMSDAGIAFDRDSLDQLYSALHTSNPPQVNACASASNLALPYNQNNGQRGAMFDITAINCVTIRCFEANFATGTTPVEIWYRAGTHVGFTNSSAGWTLVGTAPAVAGAGANLVTAIPIPVNIVITAGATAAFYITRATAAGPVMQYTNGTAVGFVFGSDANIQVKDGTGKDYPFGGSFTPRRFNGSVFYDVGTVAVPVGPVSGNTPVCSGTVQTFSITAIAGATTYNWTVPVGSVITSGAGTNSITVTMGATSGNVCVTPVVPCGIVVPSCFAVTINSSLVVTATSTPASICSGNTAQLQGNGAASYTWTPAASLSCTNCANPVASPTTTTTYSVTGNTAGCTGSATTTVTVNPNPVPVANNTGPYCAGSTITLSAGGGTSYSWSGPGAYTSLAQNPTRPASTTLMSGVYTVTVTTGTCTATTTTSVTVNALPIITVNSTSICAGQTTATLTAGGGNTYAWSAGTSSPTGTTVTASPATTTQYTVTGTALSGCVSTAVATVTVNALPVITVTNTGPYCAGTTIQLNATGGTNYSWTGPSSFAAAIQNPTILNSTSAEAGTYSATVTDANGCFTSGTTTVVVNTALVPGLSSNSPLCDGDNLNLTCTNGAAWSWTGPNTFSSAVQNPVVTAASPLASGTYSLSLTDANGCVGTGTVAVVVNALPTVTVNSPTVCNGTVANLNAGGAVNYAWSAGTSSSSGSSVTASPTITTQYTVTGTDANNCANVATSTVTINALPLVTVNSPNICPGTTANLTAGGASTYAWTAGTSSASGANVTATPASTSQFTVTGTDVNGCVSTAVSTVTVNALLVIDAGITDTVCIGNNILLNATGPAGTTFTWSPGNLSGAAQSIVANTTTTFSLSGVDANGCTGTDSVLITVPGSIILNTSSVSTLCFGSCDGQANVLAIPSSGAFAVYTYLWTTGGTGAGVTAVCAGNYSVTVTNNAGCTATTSVTVNQPTAVTASASATTPASCNGICDGSTMINANGGSGTFTYVWSSVGVGNNPTNLCAGNYTCVVADGNNCSVPVSVSITEPTSISVTTNPVSTICVGQTANLSANALGGNGGYVYTWTGGTTPTNLANVTASPVVTSSYTVSVTDVNGCAAATASVTVNLNSPLGISASADVTICAGQTTPLSATANGGNGVFTYTWATGTTPATGQSVNANPSTNTTYTVTVTDGCNTPPVSDTVVVTVNQLPVLGITSSVQTGCAPLCLSFSASSTTTTASINWVFTDGQTTSNNPNPNMCFTLPGNYGAAISVTDLNGCQNTFSNTNLVTVDPVPVALFDYGPQPVTEGSPFVTFTDQSTGTNITNWDWSFGDALGSTSTQQNPSFDFGGAGTFTVSLIVTSAQGCTNNVSTQIIIEPDFNLYVPNAFTPNGNTINDLFFPLGTGILPEDYRFIIYDRWGSKIWETANLYEGWNGEVNGNKVENEVYVWKIFLRKYDGTNKSFVGHVTVVR